MGRWWALSLVVVLGGCSPAVDAEFSDIEVTRPDIQIPRAPAGLHSSVTFSFVLQSGALGASTNPASQSRIIAAELHRLAFTAKGGITDLSFIESLHALACVPVSTNSLQSSRQVEIADYIRQGEPTPSPAFEVPISEPVDLLPLLRPDKGEPRRILVIVDLGGALPTTDWQTDVTMSLSVHLRQ
jgi:hypothetical protein